MDLSNFYTPKGVYFINDEVVTILSSNGLYLVNIQDPT